MNMSMGEILARKESIKHKISACIYPQSDYNIQRNWTVNTVEKEQQKVETNLK